MDKNFVILEGQVGNDLKYGVASNGMNYATFTLCVNPYFKDIHDSTESNQPMTYIRLFVYDQKKVNYMKRLKIGRGSRVSVFARLNSARTEINGKDIIQNNVVVRDICLIKTKED